MSLLVQIHCACSSRELSAAGWCGPVSYLEIAHVQILEDMTHWEELWGPPESQAEKARIADTHQ